MSTDVETARYVAFADLRMVAAGTLADVAAAARRVQDAAPDAMILVFDRGTAEVVDVDLRGTEEDVVARYGAAEPSTRARGRPKLGVVAREVTLLPRHWEWLSRQPGGASTTLRRLVEAAQKSNAGAARARSDAAFRFMSAMAGDLPGFEEAARALFAGDLARLQARVALWPADVRDEVMRYIGDGQSTAEGMG